MVDLILSPKLAQSVAVACDERARVLLEVAKRERGAPRVAEIATQEARELQYAAACIRDQMTGKNLAEAVDWRG